MTTNASCTARPVVLYVEDDELMRRSVTNRLRRRGFDVLPANSGEYALDLVADRPDLSVILMDVELPGMDGLETYACLKESYATLPIVICSGALSPGSCAVIERMEIPPECCLCKPCSFAEILAVLCQAIESGPSVGCG